MTDSINKWLVPGGILLAVLAALSPQQTTLFLTITVLLGLTAGVLNISSNESTKALLTFIALGVLGGAAALSNLATYFPQFPQLGVILTNVGIFAVSVGLSATLYSLYNLSKK